MPKVEVSVKIKRPVHEVYSIIKNIEDFPVFMRDVKSLKIIKRLDENRVITAWEIEVEGAPVSWKEEDSYDDASRQLKFTQVEGNYKEYQGRWLLEDLRQDTRLTIEAHFDWGIPILEKYVGRALETRARRGLLGMAQAIKSKAEKAHV
jgi:uncharacterized membrane protein